jgi:hypothetical protein
MSGPFTEFRTLHNNYRESINKKHRSIVTICLYYALILIGIAFLGPNVSFVLSAILGPDKTDRFVKIFKETENY